MIVGTAGHIDHGKTTLVRALTGVDTDRLPEEKARGISIELGYAYLDVPASRSKAGSKNTGTTGIAGASAPAGASAIAGCLPREASAKGSATVDRIGFIDVPGHERLVHTMISGATGIDFALLLVAADDGVMPQTREHLAVLSLLGIASGAVAITKVDRVPAGRVDEVRAEVAALLAGTALAAVPVVAVSARTGDGVSTLRDLMFDAARATCTRDDDGRAFRLAIDRAFTLGGIGVVVTGTVHAGRVKVGDELALTPSPGGLRARVRSLHAQNESVAEARAGQRCAVNIVGIAKEQIARGQWLVAPPVMLATDRLDAVITLGADEARPLRSGTMVHVHVGARDVMASVAVLSTLDASSSSEAASNASPGVSPLSVASLPVSSLPDIMTTAGPVATRAEGTSSTVSSTESTLTAGAAALVQLVLREPIGAWHGDRIVLRDASATRTIAGGEVLDPFAPTRYRRTPQRLAELAAWSAADAPSRLRRLLEAAPFGVSTTRWAQAEGLGGEARSAFTVEALQTRGAPDAQDKPDAPDMPQALKALLPATGGEDREAGLSTWIRGHDSSVVEHDDWALAERHRHAIDEAAVQALRDFHAREPELLGPDSARLRRLTAPRLPEPLWRSILDAMVRAGRIAVRGAFVHLPEHGLRLSAIDERLSQKIAPLLAKAGFEGAWARDLARDARESEPLVRVTLARLAQRGDLHQVVKDLCYAPHTMAKLATIARSLASGAGSDSSARAAFSAGADAGAAAVTGAVTVARFRDETGLGRKRAIQILEYFDRVGLLRRVGDEHRLRADSSLFAPDAP